MKPSKATLPILFSALVCSANLAVAQPSSASIPPSGVLVSQNEFESRFGKPIWTEQDFAQKFFQIYGVELTNFLLQPAQYANQMANLSGATPAAGLSEPSYHAVVPRIFVDSVPSNTLASLIGLRPGDEILGAYWETAPYGKRESQNLSSDAGGIEWYIAPDDPEVCRCAIPLTSLSLSKMNLSGVLSDDQSAQQQFIDYCFSSTDDEQMREYVGADWLTNLPSLSTPKETPKNDIASGQANIVCTGFSDAGGYIEVRLSNGKRYTSLDHKVQNFTPDKVEVLGQWYDRVAPQPPAGPSSGDSERILRAKEILKRLFEERPTALEIKTQRATLSLSLLQFERYLNGLEPEGGGDLYANATRSYSEDELIAAVIGSMLATEEIDINDDKVYNELGFQNFRDAIDVRTELDASCQRFQGFINDESVWLPEFKNLGAKLHTEYVTKTGLTKEEYNKIVASSPDIAETEMLDGLKFGNVNEAVRHLAKDALYGGLLSQIKLVKDLSPNATFCVYRSDGIDSLVFYENDSLLFCIQYLPGSSIPNEYGQKFRSGSSFLGPSLPSSIDSTSFIECVTKFNGLKDRPQRAIDPSGVSFIPRNLTFCPLFTGNTLFYRDTADSGEQSWKSVNLYNLANRDTLVFMEYYKLFTNSFTFMNRGAPIFVQNNRFLSETNFVQMEGDAATKWSGNTNLPETVMSWPVPFASPTLENDQNIFYMGKNYAGQFVEAMHGGNIQLFGRSDFLLAELMGVTAAKIQAEASEQALWDRYRNILGGDATSARWIADPEQRMENAEELLNYINNGPQPDQISASRAGDMPSNSASDSISKLLGIYQSANPAWVLNLKSDGTFVMQATDTGSTWQGNWSVNGGSGILEPTSAGSLTFTIADDGAITIDKYGYTFVRTQ